jgi:hypothetical protein
MLSDLSSVPSCTSLNDRALASFTRVRVPHVPQLDESFPAHWCMHHEDFAGPRNGLFHHPSLQAHKLLGIASPNSYYYGGSAFSSFQHHWEDFFMPRSDHIHLLIIDTNQERL